MTYRWQRALKALPLLLVAAFAIPTGCSHKVESPEVTIDHLEPDLVCNGQFPSEGLVVKMFGEDFTPMPFDTIEGPPRLELPSVELEKGLNVDGTAASPKTKVELSGKPGGKNADHLGWTSKELMTMTFDSALPLEPGVYSITVTQPDGSTDDTKDVALALVNPPKILGLQPSKLCNGFMEQHLIVSGENFVKKDDETPDVQLIPPGADDEACPDTTTEMAECGEVITLASGTKIQVCSQMDVTIPAGCLDSGTYDVVVTNPEPLHCSNNEQRGEAVAQVEALADGPVLFYADPPYVFNGIDTRITLYLTGIGPDFTVKLVPSDPDNCAGGEVELTNAALAPGRTNRIQATVPAGTAACTYDIYVEETGGCTTILRDGLTITDQTDLILDRVEPAFGDTAENVSITVLLDPTSTAKFVPTPRAFLNPPGGGAAIQLISPTVQKNGDELTAVVPAGTPVGDYGLVVVNPDGAVGVLEATLPAYKSVDQPPPVIGDILPQSIVGQADQSVEIQGTGFRPGATVEVDCVDAAGNPITPPPTATNVEPTCDANGCTLTATIDGSGLASGSVCVVRVLNTDGTYGDFSAIGVTNSSYNLTDPHAGTDMNEPRRALASAAIKANAASRFVYAVGGDEGAVASAKTSVEWAPVSVFGQMSPWVMNKQSLATARSFPAGTQLGRYIYVMGGNDGSGAVTSAERALVLSPEEIPFIEDADLCLTGGEAPCFSDAKPGAGLGPGEYSYRVSAVIDDADPVNLGGETLASDPIIFKLPDLDPRRIQVQLTWSAPPNYDESMIAGWRIYRTPADGVPGADEVLIEEISDGTVREYIDDGCNPGDTDCTKISSTEQPLPPGSTSVWDPLPALNTAREGAGAAAARDPSDPNRWYIYTLLGVGLNSYELLPVTMQAAGRQAVDTAWTDGTEVSAVARSQHGVWVVDSKISSLVASTETYIYLGAGQTGGGSDGTVEAALVGANGQLDPFVGVSDFSSVRVGYGTAQAATTNLNGSCVSCGRLWVFGGLASQIRPDAQAAAIVSPAPTLQNNAWNNEGLTMISARYLMGSSIQSAFVFLIGGETPSGVTSSTETTVW